MPYTEPKVSFLILDYKKPEETRLLLESIHDNVKFPFKIIYLHNGQNPDAYRFMDQGLIDQLIVTKKNNGLGVGTRDLFAACFSEYAIYVQNDQFLGREFTEQEFNALTSMIGKIIGGKMIHSISLAGPQCGPNIYSERAHVIRTLQYRFLEEDLTKSLKNWYGQSFVDEPLPNGGAGPYHNDAWREGWMQAMYKASDFIHWTYPNPLFGDNGQTAVRQNPDGSVWKHYPDTKQLWLISGPVKEKFIYPKFTDAEWDQVIKEQKWPDGKIPENEIKDSFPHWHKV